MTFLEKTERRIPVVVLSECDSAQLRRLCLTFPDAEETFPSGPRPPSSRSGGRCSRSRS